MRQAFTCLFLVTMLIFSSSLYAQPVGQEAAVIGQGAGLEEMLFVQIPTVVAGTLTEKDIKRAPVSSTTITKEMIEMTPVRNMYDLLEIYVPGLTYFVHYDSTHIGVRGSMVDRDYRSLLLLNGKLINQKATNGMTTELENWDLNDIERIEVVRGPGSVTYGPGAVTCVVNIITKDADTSEGKKAGLTYVGNYNSYGGYISLGEKFEKTNLYSYFSCRSTTGMDPRIFYMDPRISGSASWVGKDGIYSKYDPAAYYPDTEADPQIKFNTQIDFLREFSLLLRYTNSGTSRIRSWTEYNSNSWLHVAKYPTEVGLVNGSETRNRQFVLSLDNNHIFPNKSTLKSSITFDSIDGYRRQLDDTWDDIIANAGNPDPMYPSNMAWNYAENKLTLKSTWNFDIFEKHSVALGGEYSYESYGPGWGQSAKDAIIFDGSVVLCSSSSRYLTYNPFYTNVYFTDKYGFQLYNYAFLAELNLKPIDNLSVLLSGRLDKNRFSRYLTSPRASGVYDAKKLGIYRVTVQESIRMPTAVNLYLSGRSGNKADPEILRSIEFNYQKNISDFDFSCTYFRNQLKAISWDSAGQKTQVNGRLRTWGTELELSYKDKAEKHTAGINYAYTQMLDWEVAVPGSGTAISTKDYYQTYSLPSGMVLNSTGDNLLNWPNSMLKFYTTHQLTKKLKLLFDFRVLWDYAGNKEWLQMWENAARGTASEETVMDNIQKLKSTHIFDTDFRADVSVKYQFTNKLSMELFAMNFLPLWHNYRYQHMQQTVVAIKEPLTFGFRADVEF